MLENLTHDFEQGGGSVNASAVLACTAQIPSVGHIDFSEGQNTFYRNQITAHVHAGHCIRQLKGTNLMNKTNKH